MTSDLKKLQNELRKRLKDEECTVRIWRDEYKLGVYRNGKSVMYNLHAHGDYFRISSYGTTRILTDNVKKLIINYFIDYFKTVPNVSGIFLFVPDKHTDEELYKKFGFLPLDHKELPKKRNLLASSYGFYGLRDNAYIYDFKNDRLTHRINTLNGLFDAMKDLKEKEPTTNYRIGDDSYFPISLPRYIEYYFQGEEGLIHIFPNEEKIDLVVTSNGKEIEKILLPNEEDAKKWVEEFFEKAYKRRKVKNIFEPPKRYFYEKIRGTNFPKEQYDIIYQELLKYKNALAIENEMAKENPIKQIIEYKIGEEYFFIYEMLEIFFYGETVKESKIKSFELKEDVFFFYKESAKNYVEKQIEEKLQKDVK